MKKLKKRDFKKLAMMGIAGGTALATQANATPGLPEVVIDSSLLMAANCNSRGGCGGAVAYRQMPANSGYYYNNNNQMQSGGCGAAPQPNGQYYQASCNGSQPNWQPQQPYSNMPQPMYQQYPNQYPQMQQQQMQQPQMQQPQMQQMQPGQPSQTSAGCGARSSRQPIAGCGAHRGQVADDSSMDNTETDPTQGNPNNDGVYTQWETSEPKSRASGSNTYFRNSNTAMQQNSNGSSKQGKMTESDLMSQLNAQGKATYQGLDAAGKAMALKMANQECSGKNECKGMNSCKTDDHACAGKGSCAGTAKAAFKDKNLAVKVAAMKMAEKRANAASPKY